MCSLDLTTWRSLFLWQEQFHWSVGMEACVLWVEKGIGGGDYNWRLESTPKGMRKIRQQVEEDMRSKDLVFCLFYSWKRLDYIYTLKGKRKKQKMQEMELFMKSCAVASWGCGDGTHEQEKTVGASLVARWLGVCLPMQGTRVRALVWEDPTCRGADGPVSHNY